MGGYVALYLAKHHPGLVNRTITLGTKFHWDEQTAASEVKMLDWKKIEEKVPAFAKQLEQMHNPQDWKTVLQRTIQMLTEMGRNNPLSLTDYSTIQEPSLILLGDRDRTVSLDETVSVFKQLPNGQFCILPGTAHPIDQVDYKLLEFFTRRFIPEE
jgi:pimeloyl-ACP methyl ester carboxylesterase